MISAFQQISDPQVSAILLELLYGFTLCTSICFSYAVSYIAENGAGFKKGVRVTTIYNSAGIAAYVVFRSLKGLLRSMENEQFFLSYQNCSSMAFGIATIIIGASILLRKPKEACITEEPYGLGVSKFTQRFDIRAFSTGFTRCMILCPPLITLPLCCNLHQGKQHDFSRLVWTRNRSLLHHLSGRNNRLAAGQSATYQEMESKNRKDSLVVLSLSILLNSGNV